MSQTTPRSGREEGTLTASITCDSVLCAFKQFLQFAVKVLKTET